MASLKPTCHDHTISDFVLYRNDTTYKHKSKPITRKKDFIDLLKKQALITTENNALTHSTSKDYRIDFLFMVLEDSTETDVIQYLEQSWTQNPNDTLKLIANLGDVRSGKSIKLQYLYCLYWLYVHNPETLIKNLKNFVSIGCWKDLLHLLMIIAFDGFIPHYFEYDYDLNKCKQRKKVYAYKNMNGKIIKSNKWYFRIPYYNEKREHDKWIIQHYKKDSAIIENKDLIKELRTQYAKEKFYQDAKYRFFHNTIASTFAGQLHKDFKNMNDKKRISLAAKWAPSLDKYHDKYTLISTTISSIFANMMAIKEDENKCIITRVFLNRRIYQQHLTKLRGYNQIVENIIPNWSEIHYSKVPSKCMMKNRNSFLKHDTERFKDFIQDKTQKASGKTIKPYEFIIKLNDESNPDFQMLLDKQWTDLVNKFSSKNTFQQAIAVCDVSGSMAGTPMAAAIGLTLLSMEFIEPPWNSCCITFSEIPEIFNIDRNLTIKEKLDKMKSMNWGYNTDLNKVFQLILDISVMNKLEKDKIPKTLFIFTDMEFDSASATKTNVEEAKDKFQQHGYPFPTIIFWNLRSSKSVPIEKNDNGIMLSGFSANLFEIISSIDIENVTPEIFLNKVINNPAYKYFVV